MEYVCSWDIKKKKTYKKDLKIWRKKNIFNSPPLLSKYQGDEIAAIIGEHTDCETIVAAKDLLNRFNSDNFEIRNHVKI